MTYSLDGKTFVLGIGAPKSGTTWLFDYLNGRPEIYMSPVKEMHYFDAKYLPYFRQRFNRQFKKKKSILLRQLILPTRQRMERFQHAAARVAMSHDADYVAYFERFVPEQCSHFGEITPSYAQLSIQGFEDIARCFENTKVVFLLRDPVDRYHSHLRMNIREKRLAGSEKELFVPTLDDPDYFGRVFYNETLTALRTVFSDQQIHVAFYEDLFCDAEIVRLCDFLGLPFVPGAYGDKSNAAPKPAKLDPKLAALARERFAPVYDFCRSEFGERVPASWRA